MKHIRRRTICECGKGRRNLPDIDCTTPEKHAPRPLGEPSNSDVGDKVHIIVWAVKSPHRAPVWTFANGAPDNYDAIVTTEWVDEVYNTTELHRQQMIQAVARSAGIHEDIETALYQEEERQGDAF